MTTGTDKFAAHVGGATSPQLNDRYFTGGAAVTPHDTNELATYSRALYVGAAGALTIVTIDGSVVTFAAVPAGTTINVRAKIVKAAGTAATSIVALW